MSRVFVLPLHKESHDGKKCGSIAIPEDKIETIEKECWSDSYCTVNGILVDVVFDELVNKLGDRVEYNKIIHKFKENNVQGY